MIVAIVSAAIGASLAGGVAWAVTTIPAGPNDRYYACVGALGRVRQDTVRFNAPPSSCPNPGDTIRSWNAQGPQGPPGPAGTSNVATLKVAIAVPGTGSIKGPGIDCQDPATDDCTEVYPIGTTIALGAFAGSTNAFQGWSGDCGGTAPCSLTLDGAKSVTASFGGTVFTKAGTLAADSNGNGTISPGDVLGYTLVLKNTSSAPLANPVVTDDVGLGPPDMTPVRTATLYAGFVSTTSGTVTQGNTPGDLDVKVVIPTVPVGGTVTIRYYAIAHPKTIQAPRVTLGPYVLNNALLNGTRLVADATPTFACGFFASIVAVCLVADTAD